MENAEQTQRKLVILTEGDGALTLKKPSKEVSLPLSEDDYQLVAELLKYTIEHEGRGMAAIQLGETKRIFVFEKPAGSGRFQVVINPTIHSTQGSRRRIEACFSVPLPDGYGMMIKRPGTIIVSYHDEDGNFVEDERLTGNTAQTFLHEYSHLEGYTIVEDSPYGTCLGMVRAY